MEFLKDDFDTQKFYHDLLQLIDQCTHLNSMIVTSKEPEAVITGTRDVLLHFFFEFGHFVPHLIRFQPKNYIITTSKTTEIQNEDINVNSRSIEEEENNLSDEDIFLIFLICILILVLFGYLGYYKGNFLYT